MRQRLEVAFRDRTALLWGLWLALLLVCALLPGAGVLIAGIFVCVLLPLARQSFQSVGLARPEHAARFLLLGLALGVFAYLVGTFGIDPLGRILVGESPDVSDFGDIKGDWGRLATYLAASWIVGAFIEELVFRGFLIEIGARLFGARAVWPLAVGGSFLFGWVHLYQGASGVLTTGLMGMLLASIYLLTGRRVLLVMIVHGLVDTFAFVLAFTGIRPLA